MDCNEIKSLTLYHYEPAEDSVIDAICAFKTLLSHKCSHYFSSITNSQMRRLARHLRILTELKYLHMAENASNFEDSINTVLSLLPKLTILIIVMRINDFDQFSNHVKQHIYEFHARYAVFSDDFFNERRVSTSKHRTYVAGEGELCELHWTGNLNKTNIRRVFDKILQFYHTEEMKFITKITESSLEITVLMHLRDTSWLDIGSIGPIVVNANVRIFSCITTSSLSRTEQNSASSA